MVLIYMNYDPHRLYAINFSDKINLRRKDKYADLFSFVTILTVFHKLTIRH